MKEQRARAVPAAAVQQAKDRPWVLALWYLATALTAWSFGFTVVSASDLWWHLAAGRWIWEHRALPATDPWSFTAAGHSWTNHEWLADLVFHGWSRLFGQSGLVYWKWGLLIAAFLLLFHTLRRLTRHPAASYAATALAAAMAAPYLDIRPHLYSLVGYALVLYVTLVRPRASWVLPAVFLVWANLHGGVFFGWMALAVILGVPLLAGRPGREPESRTRPWLRAAGLWLACVLCSFVNPYGWGVLTLPLRYAFDATSPYRALLWEWQPPFGGSVSPPRLYVLGIVLLLAAAVYVFATGRVRRERTELLASLALAALTLAMSLKSQRFIPLLGMSEALVLAPALAWTIPALGRQPAGAAGGRSGTIEIALACLALAFAVVRLAPYPLSPAAFASLTDQDAFPVETCNFLQANRIDGKVFAYYTWGSYLHLCAGGNARVFIDGRADTVYDAETYRRYVQVARQEPGWSEVLDASDAQYVLWPRDREGLIRSLEASGRWRELYRDFVSVLLARADAPLPASPSPTPDTGWRELALGGEAMRAGNLAEAEARLVRALELDPYLKAACDNLALVQSHRGETGAARRTEERCQRIFPRRNRRD